MADDFEKAIRILSIDGGGIRGLIPAIFLKELEDKLNKPIADAFHLLAGTSTGGIIAVALAARKAPNMLIDLYKKRGSEIFDSNILRTILSFCGIGTLYSAHNLEQILRDLFNNATLKDIVAPHLLVTSYDIERTKPHFFKNWQAATAPADDFFLRGVASDVASQNGLDLVPVRFRGL